MDFPDLQSFEPAPVWVLLILVFAVGLFVVLRNLASFFLWLYAFLIRPPKDLKSTYGTWAVVTGPTDGIGRSFALELARKGLNLVLVGRSPDKLKAVSHEIAARHPNIEVEAIVLDLSGDLAGGLSRIREATGRLDVGVLVNNAGVANDGPLFFHEVGEQTIRSMIRVNVEAFTLVTEAVLPKMLERGRGAIVNMGSGSVVAIPSHPLYAVYVGTKAYVDAFSRTLSVEYRRSGIHVQCQRPLYVATKMVPYVKATPLIAPSPESYAQAAVRWIGYDAACMPYWSHSLQCWLGSFAPNFALNALRLKHGIDTRRAMKGKEAQDSKLGNKDCA